MHISNSEERQLSLPITLSSSGDDHLLTARADDEHFKAMDFVQCHDNRGFQYNLNNNNKLLPRPGGSGKSQSKHESNSAAAASAVAVSLDALEVVIVHKPAVGNGQQRVVTGGQQQAQSVSSEGCRHQLHTNCCHRRKRHNATQTTAAMPLERNSCCCCCAQLSRCHCHSVTTTHHHHCHHHHHYCGGGGGNKRHHRRHQQQLQQKHHHQHPHKLHSKRSPLPASHNQLQDNQQQVNHTKSSLDSSEEHRPYMHSAAIAIEIDAATVTENNSSTATSNFPYKVASEGGGAPMNLTPLCEQHRQRRRRGSLNSNTTIETDELSHDDDDDVNDDGHDDDDDDDDVHMGVQPEDEEQLTPALRPAAGAEPPSSSSSSTARAFAGSAPIRNECVRIKRKRFVPDAMQDYCSSCSRCSSCSCDLARTSSCSSLDEELAHELTVAVDCHRCMAEAAQQASESHSLGLLASRRSSLKSFCSCHTEGCCCGGGIRCRNVEDEDENYAGDEDEYDGDEETSGQRESFCTAADHTIMSTPTQEDAHSSTLTPLSTQEHTMRSDVGDDEDNDDDRDAITDADASSISQSAEYYSLSSTAGGGPQSAAIAPLKQDARGASGSSSGASSHNNNNNKNNSSSSSTNWSKHIRLKDNSSPLDTHL